MKGCFFFINLIWIWYKDAVIRGEEVGIPDHQTTSPRVTSDAKVSRIHPKLWDPTLPECQVNQLSNIEWKIFHDCIFCIKWEDPPDFKWCIQRVFLKLSRISPRSCRPSLPYNPKIHGVKPCGWVFSGWKLSSCIPVCQIIYRVDLLNIYFFQKNRVSTSKWMV